MTRRAFDLESHLAAIDGRAVDLHEQHVNPSYARMLRTIGFDVEYVRGQGAYLYDAADRPYLDCLGGYAVFNVGRNHPTIRDALRQALEADLPNLPGIGPFRLSGRLAAKLVAIAPDGLDTVYFTSTGSEGVEVALKYARAATGKRRFVHCDRAYHGLSMGSLSVNGNHEFRDGFGPLIDGTSVIPFNDVAALERELQAGDVAAFVVEPIQGKGVNIPDDGYLRRAKEICERYGALLIFDEIQTGFGRTGRMWAGEHWNVSPDIMVVAKALSGGYVPVGAVLSRRWIHEKVFSSMDRCCVQQSTFSQNELAMVAGLATLQVLEDEKLVARAKEVGDYLTRGLADLRQTHPVLHEVRGKGLMIALEFRRPKSLGMRTAWDVVHAMNPSLFCQAVLMPLLVEHGVLAQVAGHRLDVIKLIPPLVLTEADADRIIAAFDATLEGCSRFPGPAWTSVSRIAKNVLRNGNPREKASRAKLRAGG